MHEQKNEQRALQLAASRSQLAQERESERERGSEECRESQHNPLIGPKVQLSTLKDTHTAQTDDNNFGASTKNVLRFFYSLYEYIRIYLSDLTEI